MADTWVLIPNLNGRHWLPECLGTLSASIAHHDARVLFVDNASTDGSQEFVSEHFPHVQLLALDRNLGFVHAMNLAILNACQQGAKQVVLLNNDTKLSPDWLDKLLDAAARYPQYGILGVYQKDFQNAPSPRTQAIVRRWNPTLDVPLPELIDADWVEGSCIMIASWVFERIGYLDPLFAPAYFEEVDFCRRAREADIDVGLVTTSMIWHFGAGTSNDGPGRSRQRVLSERNYLLYHAARPSQRLGTLGSLLRKAIVHGGKQVVERKLTLREWLLAVAGLPNRYPALHAKVNRDRGGIACPILGTKIPDDGDQRAAARWIEQIQHEYASSQGSDTNESGQPGRCSE